MSWWIYLAVFLTSVFSAMGVGGGTLLLAVWALFSDFSGPDIRFLNLFLFLPVALLSLLLHAKGKLVEWRAVLYALPTGVLGAVLGLTISQYVPPDFFRMLFAFFLLAVGIKELFFPPDRKKAKEKEK